MKKANTLPDTIIKLMTNASPAQRQQIFKELAQNEDRATRGPKPNIWKALEEAKKRGEWDGEIETITPVNYSLKNGPHYYEVEDPKKRTVVCTSCPIRHGLILEAHLLTHYRIEDGVVYLNDKPLNKTP